LTTDTLHNFIEALGDVASRAPVGEPA